MDGKREGGERSREGGGRVVRGRKEGEKEEETHVVEDVKLAEAALFFVLYFS